MSLPQWIGLASLAFGAYSVVGPAPAGLDPAVFQALGLVTATIGLWATGAVAEHLTALGFFLFAMLLSIAGPEVVFSGFASQAFWLVFGGLIVGVAIKNTGLGGRIAGGLLGLFGTSYPAIITGVVLGALALAFLMPSSMGRVVLMMPVVLALADRLGFEPGSAGRNGMVAAAALAAYMPATAILPATVPTMVLVGAAEVQYGITFAYAPYLLLHFPVLGALKTLLIIGVTLLFFNDVSRPVQSDDKSRPLSRDEWILSGILALALGFWATDVLHHISPAWVALAAGLICAAPGVNLVPAPDFGSKINYPSLVYVAAVLGLGAVAADSGVGKLVGGAVIDLIGLELGADIKNFIAITLLSMITGLVTTVTSAPAVLTPLAEGLQAASGLSLPAVLMIQVIGYSTMLLPYTSPPTVVALQIGGLPASRVILPNLLLAAVTITVLIPLDYLWWQLLGYL
ncbi:MAG: SLC13 family permease [Rhodospirillales bacterium]